MTEITGSGGEVGDFVRLRAIARVPAGSGRDSPPVRAPGSPARWWQCAPSVLAGHRRQASGVAAIFVKHLVARQHLGFAPVAFWKRQQAEQTHRVLEPPVADVVDEPGPLLRASPARAAPRRAGPPSCGCCRCSRIFAASPMASPAASWPSGSVDSAMESSPYRP